MENQQRVYPSRGDFVDVVEGGYYHIFEGEYMKTSTIIVGAVMIVSGRIENDNGELEGVFVQSPSLGHIVVYNGSWYPIEGPPHFSVVIEPYRSINEHSKNS